MPKIPERREPSPRRPVRVNKPSYLPSVPSPLPLTSPNPWGGFDSFCERWKDGCGADICAAAKRRCFARGRLPADILFIGEAPGPSEDVIGQPFVGPAGHLLDHIITRAGLGCYRIAMTNLVLCIPREEDGSKAMEPDPESVEACTPRLVEFVALASPRLIVCVGSFARDYLMRPGYKHSIKLEAPVPMVDIVHPAAILRSNIAQKEFLVQRSSVILANAAEENLFSV